MNVKIHVIEDLLMQEECSSRLSMKTANLLFHSRNSITVCCNIVSFRTEMLRNKHVDEAKQREPYEPEKKVADLINEDFIVSFDNLIHYLRNQYLRNSPEVFR